MKQYICDRCGTKIDGIPYEIGVIPVRDSENPRGGLEAMLADINSILRGKKHFCKKCRKEIEEFMCANPGCEPAEDEKNDEQTGYADEKSLQAVYS